MKNLLNRAGYLLLSLIPMIFVLTFQAVCSFLLYYLMDFLNLTASVSYDWYALFFGCVSLAVMGIWYLLLPVHRYYGTPGKSSSLEKTVVSYLLLGIALQYVAQYIYYFAAILNWRWAADYVEMMESVGMNDPSLLLILYVVLVAPVTEELIYRGVTLYYAGQAFSRFWLANLLQAALFGIFHLNVVQGLYAFLLGIVLGYIFRGRKKLSYCILFHIFFNLLGSFVTLPWYGGDSAWIHLLLFAGACLMAAAGMILFYSGTDNYYDKDIRI